MKKTIVRRSVSDISLASTTLSPLLQRIYAARGVVSLAELEYGLSGLLPWQDLKGIREAAVLLAEALAARKKILIVGDFDADGATGTAVAVLGLTLLGAVDVAYLVPNRFAFGYGLTPGLAGVAAELGPDVIVTVDNGISSLEGVAAARAAGMTVLVTDHHLPAGSLPDAHAIVNPNQPGDTFASKNMAGVGVMFYVLLALRSHLYEAGWFAAQGREVPRLAVLLDLVALGTIADVVPLDRNNRILVHQGLARIRSGQCRPGILALLRRGQRDPARLRAADLGFVVAPRLNAAGRLDDMSTGIACLLAEETGEAETLADALNQLNIERRAIEQDMQFQAMAAIEKLLAKDPQSLPYGICLFEPDWHQGVTGIVAGRMKDRWHRPVVAFAPAGEGLLRGSARSIPGLHIRDVLADLAAAKPYLIEKFGGHAMAAGLGLAREHFDLFAQCFDQAVRERVDEALLRQVILSDGELLPAEHSPDMARLLQQAGPWGQSFPEPLFDGIFELLEQRIVGTKHLRMSLGQAEQVLPAIAFNIDTKLWPDWRCHRVRAAYRMDLNEYRGKTSLQLVVEHLEPLD